MAILTGCACVLVCNFSSAVPPHSVQSVGAPTLQIELDGESTEMSLQESMHSLHVRIAPRVLHFSAVH